MQDHFALWMSIVSFVQALSIGWFTYWMKRLTDKIDVLINKEIEYIDRFADQGSNHEEHNDIFSRLNKIEKRLTVVETKQGIV